MKALACGDVTGDGVQDLLLSFSVPTPGSIWPLRKVSEAGPGKGYDLAGKWLGCDRIAALYWAKGETLAPGHYACGPVEPVLQAPAVLGRQVYWSNPVGWLAPAVWQGAKRTWVVVAGDVDKLYALPCEGEAGGKLVCGEAVPWLRGGRRLRETYFANYLDTADLDGDGREEILVGGNPGRVVVLKGKRPGEFCEAGSLQVKGGWVAVDTLSVPCRVDWDGDGREDLIIGDASGRLWFWQGTSSPTVYAKPRLFKADGRPILHKAGYGGSLQGPSEAGWGYLQPTVGDWDGDGRLDVICNDITGHLVLYRHLKSAFDLRAERLEAAGPAGDLVAWRARPAILGPKWGYADRAGLLYLDVLNRLVLALPERAGGTRLLKARVLKYATGDAITLASEGTQSGRTKLAIADWDGDGDWDVLFGGNVAEYPAFCKEAPPCSTPLWLENVGSNRSPRFAEPRGIKLASGEFINLRVHDCSPWASDVDGDGRLDLVTGAEDGKVYYFLRRDLRW